VLGRFDWAIRAAKLTWRPVQGPKQLLTNLPRQSQKGDAQFSYKRTCLPHAFTASAKPVDSIQMEAGVLRAYNG
jgi:hypothetical protein